MSWVRMTRRYNRIEMLTISYASREFTLPWFCLWTIIYIHARRFLWYYSAILFAQLRLSSRSEPIFLRTIRQVSAINNNNSGSRPGLKNNVLRAVRWRLENGRGLAVRDSVAKQSHEDRVTCGPQCVVELGVHACCAGVPLTVPPPRFSCRRVVGAFSKRGDAQTGEYYVTTTCTEAPSFVNLTNSQFTQTVDRRP